MKNKSTILICACFLASCASVSTQLPVRDRFGIMEINISGDYFDDTKSYLQDIETVRVKRGTPPNSGIKSLLMIRRNDGNANCKFRELRYLATEDGYRWETERLATEISIFANKIFTNYRMRDYLQLGIAAPIGENNTNRTELVSSTAVSMNTYSGWQATYSHQTIQAGRMNRGVTLSKTVVIKNPTAEVYDAPKKYIVAECAAGGTDYERATVVMNQITALLDAIRIQTDFSSTMK